MSNIFSSINYLYKGLKAYFLSDSFCFKEALRIDLTVPKNSIHSFTAQDCDINLYGNSSLSIGEINNSTFISGMPLKIPAFSHQIWFTNPFNIKDIYGNNYLTKQFLTKKINILESDSNYTWKHILWTNDKKLIPETVKEFSKVGIIKEISEIKDQLVIKLVEKAVSKELFIVASDIFRLAVLKEFGGVYTDIDYVLNKPVTHLLGTYDFVAGKMFSSEVNNAFIASKSHHPIINEALKIAVNHVIKTDKTPSYVDFMEKHCVTGQQVLWFTTFLPIKLAFCRKNNMDSNKDVVFKHGIILDYCQLFMNDHITTALKGNIIGFGEKDTYYDINVIRENCNKYVDPNEAIGYDIGSGSWVQDLLDFNVLSNLLQTEELRTQHHISNLYNDEL